MTADTLVIPDIIQAAIQGIVRVQDLDDESLVQACVLLNDEYRRGRPLVPDLRYDTEFLVELQSRMPDHPFLQVAEPEPDDAFAGERVKHTVAMLSTDKLHPVEVLSSF